jgi:CHASE2 domain-containing sensor protein/class 3 adenylate cyclase
MAPKSSFLISKFSRSFNAVCRSLTSKKLDVVIVSLVVTGLLLGVRQIGWLQPLELAAFDQMIRLRPEEKPDPRLLVVEITEQDIKNLKQYPVPDKVLAQVLGELERHQPKAIGVDLARNVPVGSGHKELVARFQNPKLIAITYIGNTNLERVPPPPGIPEARIGFSDVPLDPDGVMRRNLMYALGDNETTLYSFSLRLALAYLEQDCISPQLTESGDVQLDKTVFSRLVSNSGGYNTIDDGDYQILLNYRSAHNVARQVSLTQVLNRQVDPSFVKDKIVLIGPSAPTVQDLFYTPYSAVQKGKEYMPGIVLHAQMVSQILSAVLDNRPLFWFWPEWLEGFWIAGWSLVGGVLVARINNPLTLGLSGLAGVGVLLGSTMLLFTQAGWIPLAAPLIAAIVTGTTVGAYQLQESKRQEQMVMKLLGQQTSPEIATALWNERDRLLNSGLLPGQRLIATMLMTDLKGFSTISEKMPPETVMAWLNEYLPVMAQEVQNHQGIINKFTGDGLLAVFGVPVPATTQAEVAEDARRAVACALAMGDRLRELNLTWLARGLPVVQMRVGIFTGPVMVGSLGGKERLEYGVIGDSVNTAARLESCEKDRQPSDCRVLIAHETLVHLQEQFEVEAWGPMELKGKQQKIDVYRVVGRLSKRHSVSCES